MQNASMILNIRFLLRTMRFRIAVVLVACAIVTIHLNASVFIASGKQYDYAMSRPVIMPFMFFGPSNQIHQAKEAIYAMQVDNDEPRAEEVSSFTLMLPPLLPHYSQSELEGVVAFSEYFEIESRSIVEERNVIGHLVTTKPDNSSPHEKNRKRQANPIGIQTSWFGKWRPIVQIPVECPVYHRWGLTGRLLERCGEQAEIFRARHGGQLCQTFTFSPFRGSLRALSTVMRANKNSFALSCFLERPMSTQLVINHVLRRSPEGVVSNDIQRWFGTANVLRLRLGKSQNLPMLTLHLRAPDPVILKKKRMPSDDFVIGKDPKNNAIVPGQNLTHLIQGIIADAEDRHRMSIRAIHIMTNDPVLADYLNAFFQVRGFSVTFSPDRSISALMRDYDFATQSVAFCGMRRSSITANIEHARLALLGKDGVSGDRFWEDIIPGAK
jgi:hypothetical protein